LVRRRHALSSFFVLCNATATTEIYTLSLHDALPIYDVEAVGFGNEKGINTIRRHGLRVARLWRGRADVQVFVERILPDLLPLGGDRKSTRLNSSHVKNSYAVFCLKKKNLGRERYNIR